jgi:predicted Zn finger-like uncharacterized protein
LDVRCERCRAQYVFDDDQVTAAGLTVQCTNCGHLFKVRKKELVVTVPVKPDDLEGAPVPANAARISSSGGIPPAVAPGRPAPAAHPTPAPDGEAQREWRVRQSNGNIFTFREMTTLQKWIIEQKVIRDDEISRAGDQWKRLGNIPELASFFQVVEAAERAKFQQLQPGITPMPNVTPMPMPMAMPMPAVTPLPMPVPMAMPMPYGIPVQQPMYPSGYPAPPPQAPMPGTSGAYPLPPTTSGSYPIPAATAPVLPPVTHEVDLGMDEEPPPPKRSRAWLVVLGLVLLAGGGAGAYFTLFAAPPPPPPPPAPPPQKEVEVPITIEMKAPEPPPAPVPAPEPVVEPPKPEKPAPLGPKQLLAKAKKLLENGSSEAALDIFGRLVTMDPSNVEALTGRGLCYLDLENYPPAEASFEAALRLEPDDEDAMLGLAESYQNQGKKAEAIAAFEKYLARHPAADDAEVAKNALEQLRK